MATEVIHEPNTIVHTDRLEVCCVDKATKKLTRRGHLEVDSVTNQITFNEDTGAAVTQALTAEKAAQESHE